MTSMTMESLSHPVRSKTPCTVGMAIPARIKAGMTVQVTSSLALP